MSTEPYRQDWREAATQIAARLTTDGVIRVVWDGTAPGGTNEGAIVKSCSLDNPK